MYIKIVPLIQAPRIRATLFNFTVPDDFAAAWLQPCILTLCLNNSLGLLLLHETSDTPCLNLKSSLHLVRKQTESARRRTTIHLAQVHSRPRLLSFTSSRICSPLVVKKRGLLVPPGL